MNSFGQTTKDEVLKYLEDPSNIEKLTPEQAVLLERWEQAYSWIVRYGSPKKVAEMLQKRFGVARSTAYSYVSAATDLFGAQKLIEATADNVLYETMYRLLKKAEAKGDLKAAGKFVAEINKYIARRQSMLPEIDPELLKTGDLIVTINPADIGFEVLSEADEERLKRQVASKKMIELRDHGDGRYGQ